MSRSWPAPGPRGATTCSSPANWRTAASRSCLERGGQRRHAHARDAREVVEMVVDGAQLEGERARIAVVEHDEVEHRRRLELAEIARAVGDRAVAQLQGEPHGGVPVDRRMAERLQRAGHDVLGALQPAAEIEEAPAGAARHVLLGQPRQDGDEADDLVERRQQRIEVAAGRHQALAHVGHHRAGRRDHVDREAGRAWLWSAAGWRRARWAMPRLSAATPAEPLLEGGVLGRRQRGRRIHQVGMAQQAAQQAQLDGVARTDRALRDPDATVVRSSRASLSSRSM